MRGIFKAISITFAVSCAVLLAFFLFDSEIFRLMIKNPQEIGAIAQSSQALARVITKDVPGPGIRKRILEVGAGTGVFTLELEKKLGSLDELHVIELMPELCSILKNKFTSNSKITIYCGDILQFSSDKPYDYIVSGLPFNSFSKELVSRIIDHLVDLSAQNASLSFFEYVALPHLRLFFSKQDDKIEFQKTRQVIKDFIARYEIESEVVLKNAPPAKVHFLCIKK